MKRMLLALAAVMAMPVAAEPTADEPARNGRYEGIVGSENSVWVLDTRTGKVRKCTQDFADQTPRCSGFSN